MARDDLTDTPPEVLEVQPDCAVCYPYYLRGLPRDPRAVYRSLGGRRPVRFGLWRAGWTASENLSVFFSTASFVLDPRARSLAVGRTPLGMLVVGVTADPRAPFRRAVRWPPGPMDPRDQMWTEVLLPPGYGYPNLYDARDGRVVTVAHPIATAGGFGRARLVAFGLNTSLAYARTYRVGVGLARVPLRTRTPPQSFQRRTWTFKSMTMAERDAFLSVVERTPTLLRTLLAEVDGAVDIVGGGLGCQSVDACEHVVGERAIVSYTGVDDTFVVLHELGHVVFDLALDEPGRKAIRAAFIRGGWEGDCCFPLAEAFSDQLAIWALGGLPPEVRPHRNRFSFSRAEFARLLRAHAAYRPLPVLGILPR